MLDIGRRMLFGEGGGEELSTERERERGGGNFVGKLEVISCLVGSTDPLMLEKRRRLWEHKRQQNRQGGEGIALFLFY